MKNPNVQLVIDQPDARTDDRRQHFRMREDGRLTYTVLDASADENAPLERGDLHGICGEFAAMTAELERIVIATRSDSPDLTAAIQCVNKKVDVLANVLLEQEIAQEELAAQLVCVSAGGVAFLGPAPLASGTRLYLRFSLSQTMASFSVEAVVRRIERREGVVSRNPYRVAAEFVGLRDSQSDLIVRHLLRRQAARIRDAAEDGA